MSDTLSRRAWLAQAALGVAALATGQAALAQKPAPGPQIRVYKSPECGCCEKWVAHVAKAGFRPAVTDVASLDVGFFKRIALPPL